MTDGGEEEYRIKRGDSVLGTFSLPLLRENFAHGIVRADDLAQPGDGDGSWKPLGEWIDLSAWEPAALVPAGNKAVVVESDDVTVTPAGGNSGRDAGLSLDGTVLGSIVEALPAADEGEPFGGGGFQPRYALPAVILLFGCVVMGYSWVKKDGDAPAALSVGTPDEEIVTVDDRFERAHEFHVKAKELYKEGDGFMWIDDEDAIEQALGWAAEGWTILHEGQRYPVKSANLNTAEMRNLSLSLGIEIEKCKRQLSRKRWEKHVDGTSDE